MPSMAPSMAPRSPLSRPRYAFVCSCSMPHYCHHHHHPNPPSHVLYHPSLPGRARLCLCMDYAVAAKRFAVCVIPNHRDSPQVCLANLSPCPRPCPRPCLHAAGWQRRLHRLVQQRRGLPRRLRLSAGLGRPDRPCTRRPCAAAANGEQAGAGIARVARSVRRSRGSRGVGW